MIEWATDYWYVCAIALFIGVATAAWIWLPGKDEIALPSREIDEPRVPLEPDRPTIERAERIDFTAAPQTAEPVAASANDGRDHPAIPAAIGAPDNLLAIKGLGPKLNTLLGSLGVTRYDQIAAWGATEIAEVDRFLGAFQGRIVRDNWVEQAALLARGDVTGFAAKFGALGGDSQPG
jgi:predicted flap endonuclease-1-like 5' DNA nuclease